MNSLIKDISIFKEKDEIVRKNLYKCQSFKQLSETHLQR